jgi:hypothetical protein
VKKREFPVFIEYDSDYNDDRQPELEYNWKKNIDKSIDELIGLAKGFIADEMFHPPEVDFLIKWVS